MIATTVLPAIVLLVLMGVTLRRFPIDQVELAGRTAGRGAASFLLLALGFAGVKGAYDLFPSSKSAGDLDWVWSIVILFGVLGVVLGSITALSTLTAQRHPDRYR